MTYFILTNGLRKNIYISAVLSVFLLLFLSAPVYASEKSDIEKVIATGVDKVQQLKTNNTNIKPLEERSNSYLLQLFSGLMIVLLSIVVLAWIAKRFNRMQSKANAYLEILGGVSMGARERVVVVQAGKTRLLLGVSPGRVNMLHVLDNESETDKPATTESLDSNGDLNKDLNNDLNNRRSRSFSQNLAAALIRKKS